ncbi:MAG TPA: ABC transporter ATP-binding protein [Paraburkholderia sp.]|jgi:peptide/nickel transport system ATP-binding protein|nr:ABC transporter ATP-binding protein [Paraburkholderia sp.]
MSAPRSATVSRFPTFVAPAGGEADALTLVGLTVSYRTRGRERDVLTDVSLRIRHGETYGLVGESGCGKSTVALAALRYLPRNGRVRAARLAVDGVDVLSLDAQGLRTLRANAVSMVYQDPASALNPSLTIARQVSEAFEATGIGAADALARTPAQLERVRIADPARVMACYPHQLSGGMQQRVVIAMALASNPTLLILDEPTTGLDATVEAEILALIESLRAELGMAVLMISHDLAVIGRLCEHVGVLYAGRLVEEGATRDVFARPRHPYTVGLLRCLPTRSKAAGPLDTIPGELPSPDAMPPACVYAPRCRLADERCTRVAPPPHRMGAPHGEQMARCHYHERAIELPFERGDAAPVRDEPRADAAPVVLRAVDLNRTFGRGARAVRAVDRVSLELRAGETLGLVGESGSGKTTLAKLLLGLIAPDAGGRIELGGEPLAPRVSRRDAGQLKALRLVFQNPDASLNRALAVRQLVARALPADARTSARGASRAALESHVATLLDAVRVPARYLAARARQLSGGLKQRVAIAQAFAGEPRVVICDEPTSALDVSVQASILNLLVRLQRERAVSYLFISHDLDVVRYLADRVAVLFAGQIVESGPADAVFDGPSHPYTETLLAAARDARTDRGDAARRGSQRPSASDDTSPRGCVFRARCPRRLGAICDDVAPPFDDAGHGHFIRCHIPATDLRALQSVNDETR